ncbi:Uncharacterised protein [uncultured archaeon]|nr:Uncharacterised protein [uncultured archaeon]
MREKLISCLGDSYIPPIFDLFEKIESKFSDDHNHNRKSFTENGYSVSIISLAMQYFESLLKRARYFSKSKFKDKNGYVFFEKRYPSKKELIQKCKEIYFVRNSIVHNFIWKRNSNIDYRTMKESRIYIKFLKDEFGDRTIHDAFDLDEKITKTLKLNVYPSNIGISDVKIILKTISEILSFLKDHALKSKKFQPLSFAGYYTYKGEEYSFFEFIKKFCN